MHKYRFYCFKNNNNRLAGALIEHTTLIVISITTVQKILHKRLCSRHFKMRAGKNDSYVVFLEERVTVNVANEKPAKRARSD